MFDQMSMPVLFAVLISTLALVSIGVFVAVRVLATRVDAAEPVIESPNSRRSRELPAGRVDGAGNTCPIYQGDGS